MTLEQNTLAAIKAFNDSSRTSGVIVNVQMDTMNNTFVYAKSGKKRIYFDGSSNLFYVEREWGVESFDLIDLYEQY